MLKRMRELKIKIKAKQEEIAILDSLIHGQGIRYDKEKIQTSGSQDMLGDTVCKILDLRSEVSELLDEYVDLLSETIKILGKLNNPNEYQVLHMRFIEDKSWNKISQELNKSLAWVHMTKNNGLKSFENLQK